MNDLGTIPTIQPPWPASSRTWESGHMMQHIDYRKDNMRGDAARGLGWMLIKELTKS
jgi:hypothetical protein